MAQEPQPSFCLRRIDKAKHTISSTKKKAARAGGLRSVGLRSVSQRAWLAQTDCIGLTAAVNQRLVASATPFHWLAVVS